MLNIDLVLKDHPIRMIMDMKTIVEYNEFLSYCKLIHKTQILDLTNILNEEINEKTVVKQDTL